jgi:hypothetical protein
LTSLYQKFNFIAISEWFPPKGIIRKMEDPLEVFLKTIKEHPLLREKIAIVDEVKEGKRRGYFKGRDLSERRVHDD